MPVHMAHKIGCLFEAAQLPVASHLDSIKSVEGLEHFRLKMMNMKGPAWAAQDKDQSTVYIYHGTSLKGAIGILNAKQIKAMEQYDKGHVHAIYGKGFIASGDKDYDKGEITRILKQMAEFPKNQCGVVFEMRAVGKSKKISSGGTAAEEEYLEKHPGHITHMRQGSANRWATSPSNATITSVWIVQEIFDFAEYDPLEWGQHNNLHIKPVVNNIWPAK